MAYLFLVRPNMRIARLIASFSVALGLVCCAQPTPPAAPPIIEGKIHAVSAADIQAALDGFYRSYRHSRGTPPSAIRVLVVDRNHIAIHYHTVGPTEQYEVFERTTAGWGIGRTILTGAPPTR